MRNRLKINTILLSGFLAFGLFSCTDGFDNFDPGAVDKGETDRDGYAVSSAMRTLSSFAVATDVNQYQFSDCLLGGNFGRYVADSNVGFNGKNFATFTPENHWIQAMFNEIIPEVFINYSAVQAATDDPVYLAVAKVLKVLALHRVTDVYGPIPYSKVGENGKLEIPYDSVEDIYYTMIEELTESVDVLTENQTNNFSANADNVYNGNVVKWIKMANTLKLRLSMRMVNIKPELAKKYAEEAVNHSVGVMDNIDDSAYRTTTRKNPLYIVAFEYNGGDSMVAADILCYMNGYNDPRRASMFQLSVNSLTVPASYVGVRSGINITNNTTSSGANIRSYSKPNITGESKLLWINAAEASFLKAEGALRGWNMGGTAEALYKRGIELSFLENGLDSGAAATYAQNSSSIPTSYSDPLDLDSYSAALSTITIQWENGNFDKNLERIITQKWIANFPLGIEAWSEYRRTGYPKFMPVVQNNSGGTVSSTRLARRVMYPSEEYTGNTQNVQEAVSKLLGGADNMGTDLWWAKKN